MHGAVHDYVVVRTIKNGSQCYSAEDMHGGLIEAYIDYKFPELKEQPIFPRILEIGSLDICGSLKTYNYINRGPKWTDQVGCSEYIGLDLIPGACVDLVANAHKIPLESNSFDLVLCANMLEHDSGPQATLYEAHRVLKPGSPFILTTVNQNWAPHPQLGGGDTETFNRITKKQFTEWIRGAGFQKAEIIEWHDNLFCYAIKEGRHD